MVATEIARLFSNGMMVTIEEASGGLFILTASAPSGSTYGAYFPDLHSARQAMYLMGCVADES